MKYQPGFVRNGSTPLTNSCYTNPSFGVTQSGNTITISGNYISGPFTVFGTYYGTITTVSNGGCNEITRNIQINVNYPGQTTTGYTSGGNTSGGTTSGGTTSGGTTTTSNNSTDIYFEGGICKCPNASVGDTATINGTLYTVVDDSTIGRKWDSSGQIGAGNYNLCTTLVTNLLGNIPGYGLIGPLTNNNSIGDITFWDTSNVTNMGSMFNQSNNFNQNISNWDTSKVTNMESMFRAVSGFNQDLSSWDTSKVTNMRGMFEYVNGNPNITSWDTSKVTDMSYMFFDTDNFNQDIGDWNTSSVTDMTQMIKYATTFNQDLTGWCVSNITSEPDGWSHPDNGLTNANKPDWGTCD